MREPRRDDPSETFGPYVLFECLGRGGMATVHRAKQTGIEGFERPVALKRMLPWLTSDPEFVKSFVREARLAAQLRHTNIAQTYDLGKVDGVYYIAMELIAGRDLREVLRQAHNTVGPVPIPIAIHILFQICDALDYAHNFRDEQGRQLGLVHRDISPANVIVGEDGCAKIVDFGVAKGSTATLHTQSGMLKGKFAYMAPEMLQGQLDARCDLFAVGVVAWELLTAKPLFAGGDDMEILQRVTSWDPPPPSSINPMVPRELDAWVQMALAKAAPRRFQTAAQMRAGLELVARVPSMRATGPDVAAWIGWAFQQKRGHVTDAPMSMAAAAQHAAQQADGNSVVVSIERGQPPPPRPHPDSRPPTVRVSPHAAGIAAAAQAAQAGMAPAQTLVVDDAAVIGAQHVGADKRASTMYGAGLPQSAKSSPHAVPHPTPAPVVPAAPPDPTTQPGHPGAPISQPYAAQPSQAYAAQPHPTPAPSRPGPTAHPHPGRPHPGPTGGVPNAPMISAPSGPMAAMPAMASGPVPMPAAHTTRPQRASVAPPPLAAPHATMIGAPIPVQISGAASSRYASVTAPPPPQIAPTTLPPPLTTPQAIPIQPSFTPHNLPVQYTPHGVPVQHTPHGVPVQHTPHGMPAQAPAHTPQGLAANAPINIAAQAGVTAGSATISLGDDPPPGTPAWAMQPRSNPLHSPEYRQATAAYGSDHPRGTPEPALPRPATDTGLPLPTPPKGRGGGLFVVIVLCAGATVGGFFLVQHFF